jgi:hypothetical protein
LAKERSPAGAYNARNCARLVIAVAFDGDGSGIAGGSFLGRCSSLARVGENLPGKNTTMTEPTPSTDSNAPAIDAALMLPHAEFRRGLPAGHFRVIVNPELARKFVRHRLLILPIALAMSGIGIALALYAMPWWGLGLVAAAVLLNRLVRHQAPKILLHLVKEDERVYFEAMEYAILEVRRAR